ncbi:type I methionyl aminopeptidase [candidate division KSB1 bacterium]|nr:type I methionyl aminopeptidase [candidate division KSB1 bacterium]
MISIREEWEIERLRKSAALLVQTFLEIEKLIIPGVSTRHLDQIAETVIRDGGGKPAFKGYKGYPATICTSIDDVVVHGIPNDEVLKEGSILSIDNGVLLDGYYSDAAKSFPVGKISEADQNLMSTTLQALHWGIRKCRTGNHLSDVSHTIQSTVEAEGYQVVRALVGHGIGTELHEEPQIPNYGQPGRGPKLQEGMVFAIEPMVNTGTSEVEILEDGWTVRTKDRKASAHFEHTVLVTKGKPEILTIGIEDRK